MSVYLSSRCTIEFRFYCLAKFSSSVKSIKVFDHCTHSKQKIHYNFLFSLTSITAPNHYRQNVGKITIILEITVLSSFEIDSNSSCQQVEELKARLDEKSRMVEKKTAAALAAAHELAELRDHSEIKDRKINVLQRKVNNGCCGRLCR